MIPGAGAAMAKKTDRSKEREKILKSKVRQTKRLIREATREIQKLMTESKRRTLSHRMLDSGLERIRDRIRDIVPHWPYRAR